MKSRLDILKRNLELCNYDVVFLTETFLTADVSLGECKFCNYDAYRCDRDLCKTVKTKGGGTIILVNKCFNSREVLDVKPVLSYEHVFVTLECGNECYLLGCTYIPPSSPLDIYVEHCAIVEDLRARYPLHKFVLLGDYNLTRATWENDVDSGMLVECPLGDRSSRHVCESFNGLSFHQHNQLPNDHGAYLDLLFSDVNDIVTSLALDDVLPNNHHHNAFCFTIPIKDPVTFVTDTVQLRDFSKCDLVKLRSYLSGIDWSTVICKTDLNFGVTRLNEIIHEGIKLSTPVKVKKSSSFPSWFSSKLKRLTFQKKLAHIRFKETQLELDYSLFSSLRSQCSILSAQCYASYLENVNGQIKSNPKYFWKYSEESRKISGFPKTMFHGDRTSSTLQETADLFAHSFSSVYRTPSLIPPLYNSLNSIDFNSCHLSEHAVLKELSHLPKKFSSGPDGIPSFILRSCAAELVRPLTQIFNDSLSTGVYPAEWKDSYVIPIFKSGDRCNVANYRGVCIQSAIPKVLDKLVAHQLSFVCKSFISDTQHGFAAKRSTLTNLLSYQHDILDSFDKGYAVHSIYTDVAKAFDRVDCSFLIAKLKSYGFGDGFLEWLSASLSGRTQRVKVGGCGSTSINVLSGVGQGSHLGPLLFSLFFNDLPAIIRHSLVLMFADDVKLYRSIAGPDDCRLLQADLQRFYDWLRMNGLELSLSKCAVMEFSRMVTPINFDYQLDSIQLPFVSHIKDLGVIFDRNLSFIDHINTLSSKCHRLLGYVSRNSKGLSDEAFCLLFKALIRSSLEYACNVWSPFYDVHIHTLERVQNKFLSQFRFRYRHEPSGCGPLFVRRNISDKMFIDKIINAKIDCPKLLETINFDCTRRLRTVKTFHVDICDTNYQFHSPMNRMMRLGNK